MGLISRFGRTPKSSKVKETQGDLYTTKSLNTNSHSGVINATSPTGLPVPFVNGNPLTITDESFHPSSYESTTKSTSAINTFQWNFITAINQWHLSKFKYTKLDLDFKQMENIIFWYGSAVIFEFPNTKNHKYIATSFIIQTTDATGYPKTIKPIFQNGKKGKILKVNQDCVLVFGGYSFINSNTSANYGIAYQIWERVGELATFANEINNNHWINKQKIAINIKTSDTQTLNQLIQAWKNPNPFLQYDKDSLEFSILQGRGEGQDGVIKIDDRINELIIAYQWKMDQIKMIVGGKLNDAMDKKAEVKEAEVSANNQLTNSIINNELNHRKEFINFFNKTFNEKSKVDLDGNFDTEIETYSNQGANND